MTGRDTQVTAEMWTCGEECACWQPRVIRRGPGERWEWLWYGTFRSEPDGDEMAVLEAELAEAKARVEAGDFE